MADINGIVTIGSSETPGEATVLLLNEAGDTIVASTTSSAGDPHAANVVSLLHFDGADASTTLVDEKGKAWTAGGGAQLDTAQSKFGGASGVFGSAGSQFLAADTPDFDMFAGAYTIEFFYRAASNAGNQALCEFGGSLANRANISLVSGNLIFYVQASGSSGTQVSVTAPAVGTWHHVALVCDASSNYRLFVNGVSGTPVSRTIAPTGSIGCSIGRANWGGGSDFSGHIDEFRVTKGVARYTANFTPPTAPFSLAEAGLYSFTGLPGDTTYRVVVLGDSTYRTRAYGPCTTVVVDDYSVNYASLLHFDGADGSTSVTDQGGHPWTANGNAQLDTAQSKFGGASLLLDGTGDYLSTPSHANFRIDGDWTIEAWVRPMVNNSLRVIAARRGVSTTDNDWQFDISDTGKLRMIVWGASGAGTVAVVTGATTLGTATWHHVAATRSGNTWRVFVNGVLDASAVESGTPNATGSGVTMIGRHETDPTRDFNGHIDEFRITKGKALYTANFTPPTQAFPNGRTVSLLHFNGADGSTTFTDEKGLVWTPASNARIDTSASKFGGASGLFDGVADNITVGATAAMGFGSGDYTVEGWLYQANEATDRCIFDNRNASTEGIAIYSSAAGVDNVRRLILTSNTAIIAGATTTQFPVNTWSHWAVCRSAGTVRGFIDGVQVWSVADARTLASSAPAIIGANYTTGQEFAGRLDEMRVTKGAARYTANFTPPTAPFPNP